MLPLTFVRALAQSYAELGNPFSSGQLCLRRHVLVWLSWEAEGVWWWDSLSRPPRECRAPVAGVWTQ